LQLDQLHFAKWSPIGGAEEQQHGSIFSRDRCGALFLAELINGEEDGRPLAYGKAEFLFVIRLSRTGRRFYGKECGGRYYKHRKTERRCDSHQFWKHDFVSEQRDLS
jgi:hypothetical protein